MKRIGDKQENERDGTEEEGGETVSKLESRNYTESFS